MWGETDHTVSNSFQNDVFSAHFTFQEKGKKEFLRLEGDIVIFKDIPKLKIAERGVWGGGRIKRNGRERQSKQGELYAEIQCYHAVW